jgi:hypothetical protein
MSNDCVTKIYSIVEYYEITQTLSCQQVIFLGSFFYRNIEELTNTDGSF